MKRTLFTIFCALMSVLMWAQVPAMMDFQSLVRDASGRFLGNQAVGVQISVLQGSVTGMPVYIETHTVTTGANGLLTLSIGAGTTSYNFSTINWANGPYFLKAEMDLTGGTNYTISQTTQLMCVPYAMYAGAAADYESRIAALERALAAGGAIDERIASLEVGSTGQLKGVFSVSATRRVNFSKGNLQYQSATKTWRFAEHQYDVLGAANNISTTSSWMGIVDNTDGTQWVDLFGWSAASSAYGTSRTASNYTGNFADWGENAISNGGNTAGRWSTLSKDEWTYLFETRANAGSLYFNATVNGQTGVVVLPDGFVKNASTIYTTGVSNFTTNSYTTTEWASLENAGAVFLPCGGCRLDTTVTNLGTKGYYWTSTTSSSSDANFVAVSSSLVDPDTRCTRSAAYGVRLVQTAKYSVAAGSNNESYGSVKGAGRYAGGESVMLYATAANGCRFLQWSDGNTDNPRTITVASDTTFTAVFDASGFADGALPGRFSVSATKKVQFSQGNLQCQPAGNTWRFAEQQYDYIGAANSNISSSYTGWIDLLGWSTNTEYGVSSAQTSAPYSGDFLDWGTNVISNGGSAAGRWATLSNDEWTYLFQGRSDAGSLWFCANVCGRNGVVVLPDGFAKGAFAYTAGGTDYSTNSYSAADWKALELAGAVFLPCGGERLGDSVGGEGQYGNYWTSTAYGTSNAYCVNIASRFVYLQRNTTRTNGRSVRLVRVAQ